MPDDAKTIINPTIRELPGSHIDAVRQAHLAHQQETARLEQALAGAQTKADHEYRTATAAAQSLHSTALCDALQAREQSCGAPRQILRLAIVIIAGAGVIGLFCLALGRLATPLGIAFVGFPVLLGIGLASFAAISLRHAQGTYCSECKSADSQRDSLMASAKQTYESTVQRCEQECRRVKETADKRRTEIVTKALRELDELDATSKQRAGQTVTAPSAKTVLAPTLAMPGGSNSSKK